MSEHTRLDLDAIREEIERVGPWVAALRMGPDTEGNSGITGSVRYDPDNGKASFNYTISPGQNTFVYYVAAGFATEDFTENFVSSITSTPTSVALPDGTTTTGSFEWSATRTGLTAQAWVTAFLGSTLILSWNAPVSIG